MEFKIIGIEDKQSVEDALCKAGFCDCDLAFANMISWRDSYPVQKAIIDKYLVLKASFDDSMGVVYTIPLGERCPVDIIKMIEAQAIANNETFRLMVPDGTVADALRQYFPDYGFCYLRSHSDYIYIREDLATLHGGRYQAKRNHVNKFKSEYDFSYSELLPEDRKECLELLERWRVRKLAESDAPASFMLELEREAASIKTAFENFESLSIMGGVIRIDGSIAAFCYGTAIADDMFCVHIEKADETYEGIFAAINQQFAEHLSPRYTFINRENDLGIQGLRRAKESYHPVRVINKYVASQLSPLMLQIRKLWLDCFVHDTIQDAEQFLLTRFREDGVLLRYAEGELISMLHIIPFGRSAYIYAVATDPHYRHQGIAGSLIMQALTKCRQEGYLEAVLIPENEKAGKWYASMGFSGRYPISFNTRDEFDFFAICDDYDYGKCDGTPDYAMVCPLAPDAPVHMNGETIILSDLL